jgi:TolA-binding protein
MSDSDRPDLQAFHELEMLVRHLGEELAAFRRRAIAAEAELTEARGASAHGGHSAHGHGKGKGAGSARVAELEVENQTLRARLESAEDRVRQMMDRVRFLRQQLQAQVAGAAGSRS